MRRAQSGFTLIELVVVIVILGILAATALPRFIDISDDAHEAAVEGTSGGLAGGVSLAHAMWLARGETTPITMEGATVHMNSSGWPENTSGGADDTMDAADCVEVWEGVMQNPPAVATASATGIDFVASGSGTQCTYNYENVSVAGDLKIIYDAANGSVTGDFIKDDTDS